MMGLSFFKKTVVLGFIVGGIAGLIAALSAEEMDRLTTTDEFCTSCHAMQAYIADNETYKNSTHQTTTSGVRPGCADCHIPKGLVAATYTHIINGVSDLWGQVSFDYEDPKVWKDHRARLAYSARVWILDNDSATCRECHVESAIKPKRKRGQKQHKTAIKDGTTCIACHYNLVHEEIEPSEAFLKAIGDQ